MTDYVLTGIVKRRAQITGDLELLVSRALDKDDQRLLRLMTKRVGVALRLQRDKDVVKSEQGPGQYMIWAIER